MKEASVAGRSSFIPLHNADWVERQRYAGGVLSSIMSSLIERIQDKTRETLLDMDGFAESEMLKNDCTPTFKGYKGYPNSLITSVNKQLVHAIPSAYQLKEGDLISFDFGVSFKGAIVDSATTLIYGEGNKEHQKMIDTARECLYNAIRQVKPGKQIGCIGNAIHKTAKNKGFRVIEALGGHGLAENEAHAAPFVPNRSEVDDGVIIRPGMSLAIEPLLVPGNCSISTKKSNDGWTIYTEDISCHEEHSIFVHSDRVEIMTHRSNELIDKEIPFG